MASAWFGIIVVSERVNRSLTQLDLVAVRQQVAGQRIAAASGASVIQETIVDTLLDPEFVTPINLTITPNVDGGVDMEVPAIASIVGITGTKAQFDTAVTDGNILYVGDVTQYTDEMARDALGTALVAGANITITPNDGADTITIAASSGGVADGDKGDISVTASGATWTIDAGVVTLAKQANLAANSIIGNNTGVGATPIALTAAQVKTLLAIANTDVSGLGTLSTQSGTFSGTSSGTNTGDQTAIVGITGTKAQFDTAVTDGNILYVGDVTQYTEELAQDAVGAMVDGSLTYVDATPLLQRAALTGAITATAGSNATVLGSFTTAQFNTALSDNDVATGGGTATGSNTGDQTSIVGITGTTAQFNTALSDGDFATGGGTATGTNTGDQTTVTGNAGTATALATGRTISLTGDVAYTSPAFDGTGNITAASTIAAGAVTLAKQADMATGSLVYRKTALAGAPEVQTLATLKTDLGLTGTNSGDQTTISGNAGTATALATSRDFSASGGGITAATVGFTGAAAVVLSASVDAGHITLARMANVATASFIGRVTALTGVPEALTGTQATTLLDVATVSLKGLMSATDKIKAAAELSAVTGLAGAIGATIADYFTTTISLEASSTYEIEACAYFTKTTNGTVVWTWAFSSAPTMAQSTWAAGPITGFTTALVNGTELYGLAVQEASTTLVHAASGSLTTAVRHAFRFRVRVRTNAATTIQLRCTESAGTVTPQAGSYMQAKKIV